MKKSHPYFSFFILIMLLFSCKSEIQEAEEDLEPFSGQDCQFFKARKGTTWVINHDDYFRDSLLKRESYTYLARSVEEFMGENVVLLRTEDVLQYWNDFYCGCDEEGLLYSPIQVDGISQHSYHFSSYDSVVFPFKTQVAVGSTWDTPFDTLYYFGGGYDLRYYKFELLEKNTSITITETTYDNVLMYKMSVMYDKSGRGEPYERTRFIFYLAPAVGFVKTDVYGRSYFSVNDSAVAYDGLLRSTYVTSYTY